MAIVIYYNTLQTMRHMYRDLIKSFYKLKHLRANHELKSVFLFESSK